MPISPINNYINIPLIITSANIPTEDVARENAIREQVTGPKKAAKTAREKRLKKGDKDFQDTAWDPSQHPSYHHSNPYRNPLQESLSELMDSHLDVEDKTSDYGIARTLLSTSTYLYNNKYSYNISYHFPDHIEKEIHHIAVLARKNAAIKHKYDLATVPHQDSGLDITL